MSDVFITTTSDQKAAIRRLIFALPQILAGAVSDVQGIALGFRSRIGYAILELVQHNFEEKLSLGQPGADGIRWPPLSREYLAYGRRFGPGEKSTLRKQAGVTAAHRHGPGETKGLLTAAQLKRWRQVYGRSLARLMMLKDVSSAKAHAAAIAWTVLKKEGAKTKLEVYGGRQVQILVDTGRGANSLAAGVIYEVGPSATYSKPTGNGGLDQLFDVDDPAQVTVGTNVGYMGAHHRGGESPKNKLPKRRLWPDEFPNEWWEQILGTAISGLVRISELFGSGKGISNGE